MERIVIKIGTNVITKSDGLLNRKVLQSIVLQVVELKKRGVQVIMVSSGAMGAGRSLIQLPASTNKVLQRQMLSAIGQTRLIQAYDELFTKHQLLCAQVLATKEDFRDRGHYLNMKNCLEGLLHDQVIPIINENDVTSVSELMFTDNDELAGLLASMLNVDALFLLTSVDGVLDSDGKVIRRVDGKTDPIEQHVTQGTSKFGRGGMQTKCRIAKKLAQLGITTHVVNGQTEQIVPKMLNDEAIGTTFVASKKTKSIKKWLAHSSDQEKGVVTVNGCAVEVLLDPAKPVSLLPVGITHVEGHFKKGDLIKIIDEKGVELGMGIAQYGDKKARSVCEQKGQKPLIHYDYLWIH